MSRSYIGISVQARNELRHVFSLRMIATMVLFKEMICVIKHLKIALNNGVINKTQRSVEEKTVNSCKRTTTKIFHGSIQENKNGCGRALSHCLFSK